MVRNIDDKHYFQYQNKQHTFILILLPSDYLQFAYVNKKTQVCHTSTLHYSHLQKEFQNSFADMKQLYQCIVLTKSKHFTLDKDDKEANIIFKKLRVPFSLSLQLFPCNPLRKIEKQERQTKKSYGQLLKQIEQQETNLQILRYQNKNLRSQLRQKDQRLNCLKDNMDLSMNDSIAFTNKLYKVDETQFRKRELKHEEQIKLQQFTTLQQKMENRNLPKFYPFQDVPFTPCDNEYLHKFDFNHNRVRLIKQFNDYYQVSSKYPIPNTGSVSINIRVIRSRNCNIYFGIITHFRLHEKYTCQHKEAMSYKLRGGKFLYEDGMQSGIGIPWVKEGQTLALSIDNEQKMIIWSTGQNRPIKRHLIKRMQNQALYVFASLHDQQDEIEFF